MSAGQGLLLGALTFTPTEVVLSLVLSVLAAGYAYRAAKRFQAQAGVSPWRLPPVLWAIACLLSWLIGLALFAVARRTTRPVRPLGGPEQPWRAEPSAVAPGHQHLGSAGGGAPGSHPPDHLPYAGWYHDPSGRHELRYWDGKGWTDYVSDQGVRSEDPD